MHRRQLVNNDNSLGKHGFADDLDIIGNSLTNIDNASRAFEKNTEKVDLKINLRKTKMMKLIDSDVNTKQRERLI